MRSVALILLFVLFCGHAIAEESPYVEFSSREVKALSSEQIEGYRAGRGMGLALAAELNGYPGPMHVLELAEELSLSPEQRTKVAEAFDTMHEAAVTLGEQLVTAEQKLDAAFADQTITQQQLDELLDRIGAIQGRLRSTHLSAHLTTRALLTPHQNQKYAVLRGYTTHEDCPLGAQAH